MALWSKYDWDSKTAAFSFFLWWPAKQTGRTWSHKLLKLFHGEIRRYICVKGNWNPWFLKTFFDKLQKLFHREIRRREEDIFVQMGLGQSYWISFYTLVCVCVCSTWCRQMMILTKTFISTATRKKLCWGDIFLNASGRRC